MRHKRLNALVAAAIGVATALAAAPASIAHTGTAFDCRAFGDLPRPAAAAPANLVAAGEFHCASARTIAVQVCAARLDGAVTPQLQPIWCRYTRVHVTAGGKAFVRTRAHACMQGYDYISYVRIVGYAWEEGGWRRCRALG
jgi:hypothetical protein